MDGGKMPDTWAANQEQPRGVPRPGLEPQRKRRMSLGDELFIIVCVWSVFCIIYRFCK